MVSITNGVLSRKLLSLSLLLLVCCSCHSITVKRDFDNNPAETNWTLFGGDVGRTNHRTQTLSPPLKHLWTFKASSAIGPSLLAVDSVLYFATLDGRFYALRMSSAKKIGRIKTKEHNEVTCAYFDRCLVFASRYGNTTLVKYDLEKGKTLWKKNIGHIASEPLITDEGIFISALYNHIDKYHFETGERLWTFKTEDQHRSSPAIAHNTLVVGCDNGLIYALNAKSGKLKWQLKTGASVFATPCIWEEAVYVGSADSTFYALNLNTGEELWTYRTDNAIIHAAATDGEKVAFGCNNGRVYCLDASSGEELWRFQAKSVISTQPVMAGKVLYFGALDHYYYGLSLSDGSKVWAFETKGRIRTAPVVWGRFLFGASEDRFVYAFLQPNKLDRHALKDPWESSTP